jgi:hypothetical protein
MNISHSTNFAIILEILRAAFTGQIDEDDYYKLIECLRMYSNNRDNVYTEQKVLQDYSFPLHYHPCDHMERLRFAFTFGSQSDKSISAAIEVLVTKMFLSPS